jgi:hypothetical protein
MHLDQALDQPQTNAEPLPQAPRHGRDLGEHVEHLRQVLGGDADPGVGDGHQDILPLPFRPQLDLAAALGIFAGVIEEIQEDLGQPRRVAVQVEGLGGQRNRQSMPSALTARPRGLDRLADDVGQRDALAAQLHAAPGDAAQVEQVVDEPCEVPHLATDQLVRGGRVRAFGAAEPEDLDGADDRGHRVAQALPARSRP